MAVERHTADIQAIKPLYFDVYLIVFINIQYLVYNLAYEVQIHTNYHTTVGLISEVLANPFENAVHFYI